MTHAAPDLHVVTSLRQRFDAGQSLTNDDIGCLFDAITTLHQGRTTPSAIHLSPDQYAALSAVYSSLMHALERAGLHLQRAKAADNSGLPWVWFYRWSGCTKQGPFGTLDAAVRAAVIQVRSGAIKQA